MIARLFVWLVATLAFLLGIVVLIAVTAKPAGLACTWPDWLEWLVAGMAIYGGVGLVGVSARLDIS